MQFAKQSTNYYVKDLALRPGVKKTLDAADLASENNDTSAYDVMVQRILDDYDFIGITERLDESMVVFKLLLNLELSDVLYMSAKGTDQFIHAPSRDEQCLRQVPSFLTPGMEEYFASESWQKSIAADMALYRAAWASLDRTIDSLGRKKFEVELSEFRLLLQEAQEYCKSRYLDYCDDQGEVRTNTTGCVLWHLGCGNDCLDEFSSQYRMKKL